MKKLILFLLLTSCNPFEITEKDITDLQVQISPNGEYKIYKYTIGMGAMGDDIQLTKIFEKDEEFDINEGFNINGDIEKWTSNDTLTINRFKNEASQPKDTLTKISFEKFGNLVLKIQNHSSINSGIINEYKFENFKIDNNKITFYGIQKILGEDIGSIKSINLGNINYFHNKDSLVSINTSVIYKTMNFKYYNGDGSFSENLPEIGIKELRFIPKKKISILKLKEVKGIFHPLK